MTINVIFDDRQPNDYERLIEEFALQGIRDYKFWSAVVDRNSVVASINASHRMVVQDAKDNGFKQCVVAEQDLMFTSPNSWKFFLDNKPEEFDLYLWGSYLVPLTNKMVCGFQLYIIAEKFYDTFLSVDPNAHVYTEMDKLGGDYHFCYPFPALQRAGFSANNKAVCDYNAVLEEKYIYK